MRADSLFPEGKGAPKAVPKVGTPAALTNELVVNAKDAIDDLWKARSYVAKPHTVPGGTGDCPPVWAPQLGLGTESWLAGWDWLGLETAVPAGWLGLGTES